MENFPAKSIPELSVIAGFYSSQMTREDAAEVLRQTRAACSFCIRLRPNVYQIGPALYLYTALAPLPSPGPEGG